jgi:septum formation protein
MASPRSAFVYLASASPRRRQLLEQIGVRHEALVADAGEDVEALEATRPGELPARYVERVTRAKLRAARERLAAAELKVQAVLEEAGGDIRLKDIDA